MDIRNYIYIDTKGIDLIYNQIPNAAVSSKITTSNQINGSLESEAKAGLITKILNVGVKSKVEANQMIQEESQHDVTVENKIQTILNHINNGRIERLFDIINDKAYIDSNVVVCKSIFRFLWAYDEKTQKQLRQSDFITNPCAFKDLSFDFASSTHLHFYSEDIDISKSTINQNGFYVDMYFNGSKLVREVRHITNNIKYNKDFIFCVIGELAPQGRNIFCLKPYVIWRMTDNNM